MDSLYLVYTTWPNVELAETAAREIVEENLAACANVIPAAKSFYRWKGEIETAMEAIVIFKTSPSLERLLEEKIKTLHTHECPCILGLEVSKGHPAFFDWVHREVAQ